MPKYSGASPQPFIIDLNEVRTVEERSKPAKLTGQAIAIHINLQYQDLFSILHLLHRLSGATPPFDIG
jgi:hypothetical protein